jgi:ABC-type transport system involved in multi-copper enzyme maturation permease subunit
MYRTLVILRHTFLEAIVQPIYSLLLGIGSAILLIFGLLPFFTLGEDTIMYKSVALDVVLLLALVITLFATSRSIYEEIEDRTMLTLMSKPIQRWEVLVGKYLGIILSTAMVIAIFGIIIGFCTYVRIPMDYQLRAWTLDDRELKILHDHRVVQIVTLLPTLVLVWLQVSVLAAIGVALSTRFSLVVNLPSVILIYIAGNLTRFLFPLDGRSPAVKAFAYFFSWVLPFLQVFDLRSLALYHDVAVPGTDTMNMPGAIPLGTIWLGVLIAGGYAIAYAAFALGVGMWLFQTRELGGAEG